MDDEYWMREALKLAERAAQKDEVPVGAVVVLNNKIIGSGYNQTITLNDPSAHAEVLALREAAKKLNNYRLIDTTLYCTLEPCTMCEGLLVHARIKRLVFAAFDPNKPRVNHHFVSDGGVLADESAAILKSFFQKKR